MMSKRYHKSISEMTSAMTVFAASHEKEEEEFYKPVDCCELHYA